MTFCKFATRYDDFGQYANDCFICFKFTSLINLENDLGDILSFGLNYLNISSSQDWLFIFIDSFFVVDYIYFGVYLPADDFAYQLLSD